MEQLGEACAGGAAGVIAMAAVYPLVVIKTRLQSARKQETNDKSFDHEKHHYKNALDCFLKICKYEGLKGLFKGINSSLPKTFLTNFVFYYFYAWWKPIFARMKSNFFTNMLHGILAGIGTQCVMLPFDITNVRVIADKTHKTTFTVAAKNIYEKSGLGGFYKGLTPGFWLTLNPGISNVVRKYIAPSGLEASAARNFWAGAGSKAVASVCTYPFVVSKVQMYTYDKQSHKGNKDDEDSEHKKEFTILGVMSRIIQDEGVRGLYKGLEPHLATAILKEAILNTARHSIYALILSFFTDKPVEVKKKAK